MHKEVGRTNREGWRVYLHVYKLVLSVKRVINGVNANPF